MKKAQYRNTVNPHVPLGKVCAPVHNNESIIISLYYQVIYYKKVLLKNDSTIVSRIQPDDLISAVRSFRYVL